jgi:hypothetical protein
MPAAVIDRTSAATSARISLAILFPSRIVADMKASLLLRKFEPEILS